MKTGEMMASPETAEPQDLEQMLSALVVPAVQEVPSRAMVMEVPSLEMVPGSRRARAVLLEMEIAVKEIQEAARADRLPERI